MFNYPYSTILCNGRPVAIDDVVNSRPKATSKFEESLFSFIREWLSGVEQFSLTTSGSTGPPKTILGERRQMMASAKLTAEVLHLEEGQTALICLSPEYIAGKMMVVRCIESGLKIVAVEPSSNPLEKISEHIDFTAMVPLQVHEVLHNHGPLLSNVGTIIVGGGAIDAKDLPLLRSQPCRFYATYGMTETLSHVALRRLNGGDADPYYTALPGITFSTDDRGCLVIDWPAFGNTFVTNDLVEIIDSLRFIWLGRWDNVINTGGIKILPEMLEKKIAGVLAGTPYNERFFIAGVPDRRLGTKLALVIESNHSIQMYNTLLDTLKSSLQGYEVPKVVLRHFPFIETQTGKVDRTATLKRAISDFHSTD